MQKTTLILVIYALIPMAAFSQHIEHPTTKHSVKIRDVDAEHALRKLIEGNKRFATHHMQHPDETIRRRVSLSRHGQHPFAIVLSCSDSRVPPEIVFDEGLGDLFVVRIAGHVVDDAVIASIEYAAEHLGAKLLVVLGHEKCGAVTAAIENQTEAHLRALVEAINPAVEEVVQNSHQTHPKHDETFIEKVVVANIRYTLANLQKSEPLLARLIRERKLKTIGCYYHLTSGKAELIN